MFRVIVQLSCMIVLASVLYDIFSCTRFHKRMFFIWKWPPAKANSNIFDTTSPTGVSYGLRGMMALAGHLLIFSDSLEETQTYKYVMYVRSSKYGKILLKKLKKVRRICFKSLGWFSCNTPIDNRATVNQVKPCVHFADCSLDLKKNIISLIHYVVVCFGEKMSLFQHPILSCNYLAAVANAVVAGLFKRFRSANK